MEFKHGAEASNCKIYVVWHARRIIRVQLNSCPAWGLHENFRNQRIQAQLLQHPLARECPSDGACAGDVGQAAEIHDSSCEGNDSFAKNQGLHSSDRQGSNKTGAKNWKLHVLLKWESPFFLVMNPFLHFRQTQAESCSRSQVKPPNGSDMWLTSSGHPDTCWSVARLASTSWINLHWNSASLYSNWMNSYRHAMIMNVL